MNQLDRVISWFSPAAGLRRERYRRALDVMLSYDGAKGGRLGDGWRTASTSANAEIGPALSRLRDRCRDLERNNPYARRAVLSFLNLAIGPGPVARPKDKKTAAAWLRWVRECDADGQLDFAGLIHLAAHTIRSSGEVIVRLRRRYPGDMEIPLQLQVLEPDHLDHNKIEQLSNGYIINGVEFDALGRRVAYWLFQTHPGEVVQSSPKALARSLNAERVPASEVLHAYRKDRPGQVRGVPDLTSVITTLRNLDDYEDADLIRKKVEACMVAVVTKTEGGSTLTEGETQSDGKRWEQFEPGMVAYTDSGEEVTFNDPKPSGGFAEYVQTTQGKIAAGAELMRWQLSGNLGEINYSAYRAGLSEQWPSIEVFRWMTLVPMLMDPIYRQFIDTARLAGKVAAADYEANWAFPPKPSVDPVKDAEAKKAEIRSGHLSWPESVAQDGYDPEQRLEEIAAWNQKLDQAGVVLDCDPRQRTVNGNDVKGGANGNNQNSATQN